MTEGAFRSLSWESVDPLVAGPWQRALETGSRPFAVPTAPPGEFRIGRLRGAADGAAALPAIDRLAAVPQPRSEDVARTAAHREVIDSRPEFRLVGEHRFGGYDFAVWSAG